MARCELTKSKSDDLYKYSLNTQSLRRMCALVRDGLLQISV